MPKDPSLTNSLTVAMLFLGVISFSTLLLFGLLSGLVSISRSYQVSNHLIHSHLVFLTSAVSLEAIILAIFVLISQNRAAKVADIREEVQLQINTLSEEESTKIMRMLVLLLQKNNIPIPEDKELREMLKKTDTAKIEKNVEKQISKS